MILKNYTFGIITGKLRITPEDALKLFGFKMKPNEKFIVFRRWKGKVIINHYTPTYPKTKIQLSYADTMAKLSKIFAKSPQIHKQWLKMAKNKKYGPLPAFIKDNINNIVQHGFQAMLLNKGEEQPPRITSAIFSSHKKIICNLKSVICNPTFAILNQKDYKLYFISPMPSCHSETPSCHSELVSESQTSHPKSAICNLQSVILLHLPHRMKKPIIFAFYENSNSVAIRPTTPFERIKQLKQFKQGEKNG